MNLAHLRSRSVIASAIATMALPLVSSIARGQDITWKKANDGNWNLATNWAGGIPASLLGGNQTAIAAAGNYTVTLDSNDNGAGKVTDLTLDNAMGTLLVTNGKSLSYNAALGNGVTITKGTLRLLDGNIVQGIAGNAGMTNFGRLHAEGTSSIGAKLDIGTTGELRIISQIDKSANFTSSGNINNEGLVAFDSRAVNGFTGGFATFTVPTLTNVSGATFSIAGPSFRTFRGNLTNNAGGNVLITAPTTFDRTGTTSYTNNGTFTLAGLNAQLDITGAGSDKTTFTQSDGVLSAGGTGGVGSSAAKFTGNSIRFNYSGGSITNGPIRLINSQLSIADAAAPGAMFQIEAGAGTTGQTVTTELLTHIKVGQTVSVFAEPNKPKVEMLANGANLWNKGTLNFVSIGGPDRMSMRLVRADGVPQFVNVGTINFGFSTGTPGDSFKTTSKMTVFNSGTWNVNSNASFSSLAPSSFSQERDPQGPAEPLLNVAQGQKLEFTNGTARFKDGKVTGTGTIKAKGSTQEAGKIIPGKKNNVIPPLNRAATAVLPTGAPDVDEPGVLSFDSDFEQWTDGALDIAIAGEGSPGYAYSQLAVTGDAILGGNLELNLFPGADPSIGSTFDVLTARTIAPTDLTDPSNHPIALYNPPVFNGKTFQLLPPIDGDVNLGVPAILRVEVIPDSGAVPEPTTLAMLIGGLPMLLRRRRRRGD